MEEIWKPIDGYPNYRVSNLGRIKSLNYNHTGKEQILKTMADRDGYLHVCLYKDKKKKFTVHRLVAMNFLSNADNLPCINHKDEDKANNFVYINDDGTYKNGAFKISTASAEFGTLPTGVQIFAMLVINDDADKKNDITPFIKSYIRLVTNAEKSSNQFKNNKYAYSYGNTDIDKLYKVVVRPCYYNSSAGKFVLGVSGNQGLQLYSGTGTNGGKYYFDSNKDGLKTVLSTALEMSRRSKTSRRSSLYG